MMTQNTEFEGFRIDDVLSRSSTTCVYRAWQHSLRRPVLIKELRPELFREDDIRRRFDREAQVCAHIKHENIIDIYHFEMSDEQVYLVMEYVEGQSLEDYLQKNPVPSLEFFYALMLQILTGLGYAHSRDVIHRDIKPGNVLIGTDGWVKITDFGLSQFEGAPQVTRAGAIVGTPAFLSPEAISGGSISLRSDIFSLGVTFYQALTGRKIFGAEHFSDSLNKVLSYNPPKLSQVRDDVPPELDRVIQKMLEKQPDKRWGSCQAIIDQLKTHEIVKKIGDPANRVKVYMQGEDASESKATISAEKPHKRRKPKSRAWLWGGIGAVLAMIMLTVFISFQGREEREPAATERQTPVTVPVDSLQASTPQDNTLLAGEEAADTTHQTIVLEPVTSRPENRSSQQPDDDQLTHGGGEPEEVPPRTQIRDSETQDTKTEEDPLIAEIVLPPRPAWLRLQCDPWADVYLDGNFIGKTPLEIVEVLSGDHRLVFRHPKFPPIVRDLYVEPGRTNTIEVNFWETVARLYFYITPWAEVHI
ncbi:MAG: serine/threonine-protein kinase, partial [bacterium]